MSLETTHPHYDAMKEDWTTMRDLNAGERAVKAKRETYLPPTPSMVLDGFGKSTTNKSRSVGDQTYDGYIVRALFSDFVNEGVEILVGMLHHKEAEIKLPAAMEPLRTSATLTGESLLDVLRRINTEQLITGRVGLLADLPIAPAANPLAKAGDSPAAAVLPYIATYIAESITNWDEGTDVEGYSALNLVVLNESGLKREADFSWKDFKRFRVLQLGDLTANEQNGTAQYMMGVFDNIGDATLQYTMDMMKAPVYKGAALEEVPFVFINTKDLLSCPDKAPLMGLGRLVLAIYRGDADYRQALFMTGQDTLVVIGGTRNPDGVAGEDDAIRTGAGSRIDVDVNGDAKYIGVQSTGLSELRESLQSDKRAAATRSGQLLPSGKANSQESGEALKTRISAQTASLVQIAQAGAKGLETLLKCMARWIGANEDEVEVKPNMEFGELELNATDIAGLMAARLTGAPLSKKSIHQLMVQKRLTSMTYEDEMEQIAEEDAEMPRTAAGAGTLTADEQLQDKEADREAAAQANADKEKNKAATAKRTPAK